MHVLIVYMHSYVNMVLRADGAKVLNSDASPGCNQCNGGARNTPRGPGVMLGLNTGVFQCARGGYITVQHTLWFCTGVADLLNFEVMQPDTTPTPVYPHQAKLYTPMGANPPISRVLPAAPTEASMLPSMLQMWLDNKRYHCLAYGCATLCVTWHVSLRVPS